MKILVPMVALVLVFFPAAGPTEAADICSDLAAYLDKAESLAKTGRHFLAYSAKLMDDHVVLWNKMHPAIHDDVKNFQSLYCHGCYVDKSETWCNRLKSLRETILSKCKQLRDAKMH